MLRVAILGAGVQGTLLAVRLSRAGHHVVLIARGARAEDLRRWGARIKHAITLQADTVRLSVAERVADVRADLCFVTVRREQLSGALSDMVTSPIRRIVVMVNHGNGSSGIFTALGRDRVVLAFPGAAGYIEGGVDHYVDIREQPTAVDKTAADVVELLRCVGFRVDDVRDMDAWLRRHAVFVTTIAGALYESGGDARRLAANPDGVRAFILATREGWSALDRRGLQPAPLGLRTILCWVPSPAAVVYWQRLLRSRRGDLYFAQHIRHAVGEMAALAADVRASLDGEPTPNLDRLYGAIDREASTLSGRTRAI